MKQLLILGNGFDLKCGLKTRYCDFFKWRFLNAFKQDDISHQFINILESLGDKNIDYFSLNKINWERDKNSHLTRWDCIFLAAEECLNDKEIQQWQNIENIIFNVISLILVGDNYSGENLNYKNSIRGNSSKSGKDTFINFVRMISQTQKNSKENVAITLLKDLKNFEHIFADYVINQIEENKEIDNETKTNYIYSAQDLLERLTGIYQNHEPMKDLQIDVLSFNYSLNKYNVSIFNQRINELLNCNGADKYNWKINSWSNIHGIANYKEINDKLWEEMKEAPAPIFGIDNHDILNDNKDNDLRIIFTKSFRIVNDNVNSIREDNQLDDYDLITIFGHSLGRADYSYFETIFDECDLYNSKTKVEFYYYPGEDKINKSISFTKKVNNLLTHYGQTLSISHGENIVNKLTLEKRLIVKPNPTYITTQHVIINN